jgi:carboxypeptidase PM20D1
MLIEQSSFLLKAPGNNFLLQSKTQRMLSVFRFIIFRFSILIWFFAIQLTVQSQAYLKHESAAYGYRTVIGKPEEFLQKYIRIPSYSGDEKQAAEFMMTECKKAGLFVRKFMSPDGDINFSASLYPLEWNKPNLIFLNHLDIIPTGDSSSWKFHPFSGEIIDEEICGRGSLDNKGVAIMQLFAITRFIDAAKKHELPLNVTFLSVSCEETQCPGGAQYIANNYLDELNPYALIGEGPPGLLGMIPSNPALPVFAISIAHKRNLWLNLEIEIPVSGHGSVTPIEYANQEMIIALSNLTRHQEEIEFTTENVQLLKKLGSKTKGIKGFILKHPRWFTFLIKRELRKQPELLAIFKNTITITGLSSSSFIPNVIPGKVNCLIDCRLLPMTDETFFLNRIKKILDNEMISIKVIKNSPSIQPSNTAHPVYELLSKSITEYYGDVEIIPLVMPYSNDSGFFRTRGVPCFDVIPVILSKKHLRCLHNTNETLPLSALHRGIEIYSRFIDKVLVTGEAQPLTNDVQRH